MSSSGLVNVQGSVKIPFSYPIEKYSSLSKIIPNEKFLREDSYKFAFILKTKNKKTLNFEYKTVNFWNIFKYKKDLKLKSDDELFILSNSDLEFLLSKDVINALNPQKKSFEYPCLAVKKLDEYSNAYALNGKYPFLSIQNSLMIWLCTMINSSNNRVTVNNNLNLEDSNIGKCPQIFKDNPDILKYLIGSMITLRGEITRLNFIFQFK